MDTKIERLLASAEKKLTEAEYNALAEKWNTSGSRTGWSDAAAFVHQMSCESWKHGNERAAEEQKEVMLALVDRAKVVHGLKA